MFTQFQEIKEFMDQRKSIGIKPGVERMTHFLYHLHHPENRLKAVHVAGTNGKGSTIQIIASALQTNGYRVGVFTSPSLAGLEGYIWNNEQKMNRDEWITIMNDIYPAIQAMDNKGDHPTTFEIITVVALVYFSMHVDIALIETGMGGRYDTTNCIYPILSIITNVARDHTAFLGEDKKEIAFHKAGIIKQNTPLVLGDIEHNIFPVFEREAMSKNAKIYRLHHDFTYEDVTVHSYGQEFFWKYDKKRYEVKLSLHGKHQVTNTSLALMALSLLTSRGMLLNWKHTLEAIYNTRIPGRFEILRQKPFIVADGAHNPAGAAHLTETIDHLYPNEKKHLIFAAFNDKDFPSMMETLNQSFQSITLTTFADERAASASCLYNETQAANKYIANDWKKIIHRILKEASAEEMYFITGSLSFITLVRSYVLNK